MTLRFRSRLLRRISFNLAIRPLVVRNVHDGRCCFDSDASRAKFPTFLRILACPTTRVVLRWNCSWNALLLLISRPRPLQQRFVSINVLISPTEVTHRSISLRARKSLLDCTYVLLYGFFRVDWLQGWSNKMGRLPIQVQYMCFLCMSLEWFRKIKWAQLLWMFYLRFK